MTKEVKPPKYEEYITLVVKPDELAVELNTLAKDGWKLQYCMPAPIGRALAVLSRETK